jgi:DNA polymerase III sliding clamp (beta) subunit (PCNA family)
MLAATMRGVDDEESKYGNTKALEFRVADGCALMVACNGYLGFRAEIDVEMDAKFSAALSRAFFRALPGLFATGTANCIVSDKAIKFENGNRAVSGKLMAGKLPDFDSLFNRPKDLVGEFEKAAFQQALRRLMAVFDDTDKTLKPVSLALGDGWIELTAEAKDVGAGNDGFVIDASASAFDRRSNALNFRRALDVCESERVKMSLAMTQIRFDATWLVTESLNLRFTALCATLA